jgi:hypothetical protein
VGHAARWGRGGSGSRWIGGEGGGWVRSHSGGWVVVMWWRVEGGKAATKKSRSTWREDTGRGGEEEAGERNLLTCLSSAEQWWWFWCGWECAYA